MAKTTRNATAERLKKSMTTHEAGLVRIIRDEQTLLRKRKLGRKALKAIDLELKRVRKEKRSTLKFIGNILDAARGPDTPPLRPFGETQFDL